MLWFKKAASQKQPGEKRVDGGVKLTDIIPADAVKVPLAAANKEAAIEELMDCLVRAGTVPDRAAALACVRKREAIAATGIGGGIAIPHGKDASIPRLVAALGVSQAGVDFGGEDGIPARIVILLLARTDNPGPHIQALAQIAQMIQSPGFVERLMRARDSEEALAAIRSEE